MAMHHHHLHDIIMYLKNFHISLERVQDDPLDLSDGYPDSDKWMKSFTNCRRNITALKLQGSLDLRNISGNLYQYCRFAEALSPYRMSYSSSPSRTISFSNIS